MKYRLVELLQCPRCRSPFTVSVNESHPVAVRPSRGFRCQTLCGQTGAAVSTGGDGCGECVGVEVVSGSLTCGACRDVFPIIGGVPWLQDDPSLRKGVGAMDPVAVYSHLWRHVTSKPDSLPNHLEPMQTALGETIVQGGIGLDAGSGCGADTLTMASRHPDVEVISLDLSEGVYETYRRATGLPNVHVVRASVLAIPLRSNVCNFVYSFGVLHHTPDPDRGIRELARVMKPNGNLTLYLYEDHGDNPWKRVPIKGVAALRKLTTRLPPVLLSMLCFLFSPFVVLVFSIPARMFGRFGVTRSWGERMPFNFGCSLFSVHADLLDRFGAPIEVRYTRQGVLDLLRQSGLTEVKTTKLRATAGWVTQALKLAV